MKVIVAVIFTIGSASAIGSGPYLPSNWRPKGPAFYLPTEVQPSPKLADSPLKETLLFEAEASGSEGLREYGPPKEALSVQALPDVVTDNTFYVVDNSVVVEKQAKVVEEKAEVVQEATTESQALEVVESTVVPSDTDVTTASEAVTDSVEAEIVTEAEVVTDKAEVAEFVTERAEIVAEVKEVLVAVEEKLENIVAKEEKLENIVVTNEQKIAEVVQEVGASRNIAEALVDLANEIKAEQAAVEEKVESVIVKEEKLENIVVQDEKKIAGVIEAIAPRNIAEALVNVENEVKAEQVLQSVEAVIEPKVTQEGLIPDVPEGFLEYGPPGFREYGPPKGEELRSDVENEVRRRRFSPKFGIHQSKKH